ncbi:1-(5-phosphoribosyl)-5-[(5-phosphoribosylamino)methylideneamino]imidazole-4-carboxamide isomerase [Paenibacillus caui]|uniref:1-(5-phosphoribosyl)-5-[(5- phosphoribosylamino)methylideneamino]imidazole-4- carboxamide isomerase n=1 Tax=Paenibacillus caui TaxID=2873927 RepID=UPI001CA9B1DB|nr:1-(5-phosphoribosyl)-5-[(5-phosphoribosylamino)methylideneamino]imidazole-4-carboxamide isomerase [Paenibacillus caui]
MSSFTIYPAIDIRGGKCVRLVQGDYDRETVYHDSPVEAAKAWEAQGGEYIHLVDLDGAKAGHPVNHEIIGEIARSVNVPVQVGGGLRKLEDVKLLLGLGVSRVILGTAAIEDRSFTEAVLAEYGSQVAIGIDARNGLVATRGWLETTEVKAEDLAKELAAKGAETFIFTDISRDGMMQGPNTEAIVALAKASGRTVIASGGVTSQDDLLKLAEFAGQGVGGAIVGKALYTGGIDLSSAISAIAQSSAFKG